MRDPKAYIFSASYICVTSTSAIILLANTHGEVFDVRIIVLRGTQIVYPLSHVFLQLSLSTFLGRELAAIKYTLLCLGTIRALNP